MTYFDCFVQTGYYLGMLQYALVDGERLEAQPGLRGICPLCGDPTVARCGDVNIWHWSHLQKLSCDPWWENETDWHRAWKRNFPKAWHEYIHFSADGEKHIADVKTGNGWILEFQHSYLDAEERRIRDAFYKNVVWVVDGLKRKTDLKRFFPTLRAICTARGPIVGQVCNVQSEKSALFRDWSGCTGPVFFDFGHAGLWCLLPIGESGNRYVVEFSRLHFIQIHNLGLSQSNVFPDYIQNICTTVEHFTGKGFGAATVHDRLKELPLFLPKKPAQFRSFARPLHRSPRL